MRLTIGKKLACGFGVVILLMVATATIAYVKVAEMNRNVAEVVDEVFPTIGACDRLMNGVNQTAAALRGYIILNADPQQAEQLKASRADGWIVIDRELQNLLQLAKRNQAGELDPDMQKIVAVVEEVRVAQQSVEEIAPTEENVPAQHLLRTSVLPAADAMLAALAELTEEDAAAEQQELLEKVNRSERSLQESLAGLRQYVWSGRASFRSAFEASWARNQASYDAIQLQRDQFTPSQREHWERYSDARSDLLAKSEAVLAARDAVDWHRSNYLFATETMPRAAIIRDTLERIAEAATQRKNAKVAELVSSSRALVFTLVFATALAVAIGTVVAVLLSRQIISTARRLADRAQQIAEGDLTGGTLAAKSADELGQLADGFDVMLLGLRDLTSQIHSVTENVNSAATQISSSATQQAASTKEQAATVQEITSTMQEISQSGMQIVEKAREVANTAEATAAASKSGIQAVQTTNSAMHAIREQVEEVAENIVSLSEKTQAVGDIIATVTDVAEQSNLLALNATIEAAEAGTEGNRFSVVASEMKNLADQAKGCTVQVRTLLIEIQKGINSAVMLTEEAVKRVEMGKQQAELSEESIRQMSETTKQSVQAFQQIIAATNQQQVGFDQVTQGMRDIDQATQQTATGTSQLEQAVLSLSSLSQQLKTAVATYRV